ncbi:hypothetical protein JB92DRAFT_2650702, partial [Gautieria morchelliformis]
VVEQHVSNLAQGAMCLVLLTGLFLHVLAPDVNCCSWYMGLDALSANGITAKIHFLLRDRTLTSPVNPLHNVWKSRIMLFTLIELIAFGATMAIVQTTGLFTVP